MSGLRWMLFDTKFSKHRDKYFIQCGVATITVLLVLLMLDAVQQTVLIGALGASSFIAFTMPHVNSAQPRYLIGGYIVGIAVGCVLSTIAVLPVVSSIPVLGESTLIVFGASATGLAIFFMVTTNTEHPPAAAVALGFVLNEWDLLTVLVVLLGIVSISLVKEFCKPILIDLL